MALMSAHLFDTPVPPRQRRPDIPATLDAICMKLLAKSPNERYQLPEALLVDLGDPGSNILKLRILWWTKSPRQHEMLTSYDSVLTAIRQALSRYETGGRRDQGRAA